MWLLFHSLASTGSRTLKLIKVSHSACCWRGVKKSTLWLYFSCWNVFVEWSQWAVWVSLCSVCAHMKTNACHSMVSSEWDTIFQLVKQHAAHQVDGRLFSHFPLALRRPNRLLLIKVHLLLWICVVEGRMGVRVIKRVGEGACTFTKLCKCGMKAKVRARVSVHVRKRESNDRSAGFGSAAGGGCLAMMKCLGSTSSSQEVFSRSQQINLRGGHLS